MREHHISGLPRPKARRRDLTRAPTTADLVNREFSRDGPNPAVDDRHHRAPHPRRQALLLRGARRLVPQGRGAGPWTAATQRPWSTPRSPWRSTAAARAQERWSTPTTAGQFTSWTFSQQIRSAGLVQSLGTVGDAYDNAVVESFLGTHANRTPQHQKMEDPRRALHRDLRLDRSVLQSPAAPLGPREHRTRRIRATPPTTTQSRLTPTTTVQQAGDTSRGLKSGPHLNPPRLSVRGEKRPRPRCLWCGSVSSIFSRVCAGASFTAGAIRAGLRSRVMVAGCPG